MDTNGSGTTNRNASQIQLNKRLWQTADEGGPLALLALAVQEGPQLSLVNMSTVMHRLARTSNGQAQIQIVCDGRLRQLLQLVEAELETQHGSVEDDLASCLSTLALSCATLQLQDQDALRLLQLIGRLSVQRLHEFKPSEFTNLLWSFAKANVEDVALFKEALTLTEQRLPSFSASCLSTLVWTFATSGYRQHDFFKMVAEAFVNRLLSLEGQARPVDIANLMWGLATVRYRPPREVLNEVGVAVTQILSEFKLQELSVTLWAFSRLGESHDKLFAATADFITESADDLQWNPQAMSNLLWAFAKQVNSGSAASHSLARASEIIFFACERLLLEMKAQEWCSILWAISHLTHDSNVAWRQLELLGRNAPAYWRDASMSNCVGFLAALARLAHVSVYLPHNFPGLWQGAVHMCIQRKQEMEASTAIQLLELPVLPAEGLVLLPMTDLRITAASIVVRDIGSIEPAGLMRLVNCKLHVPEESLNSLVTALAGRILHLGFENFHPEDQEHIMAFCACYFRNVQARAELASLQRSQSEVDFQAAQNARVASPGELSHSPWTFQAVQNIGGGSLNNLSHSSWASSGGQLSVWKSQDAHFQTQSPECYQEMTFAPTILLPQAMCYSVDKLSPSDADCEECASVVSTSMGDLSDPDTSGTGSEPETSYEVKNTFVHIPKRKCSGSTSRARSLDVRGVH
jgi:hypothetical protein